jgi:hypothetical protein
MKSLDADLAAHKEASDTRHDQLVERIGALEAHVAFLKSEIKALELVTQARATPAEGRLCRILGGSKTHCLD